MFLLNLIFLFFIPITLGYLGLLVFQNNPKGATNRMFFGVALTCALSAGGVYLSRLVSTTELLTLSINSVMFAAAFATPFLALFVLAFPKADYKFSLPLILAEFGLGAFFAATAGLNLMFKQIGFKDQQVFAEPGPILTFYFVFFLVNLIFILGRLIRGIITSTGKEKEQFKYLAFGLIATLLFIGTFNLVFVAFLKNTNFVSFGVASFIILIGSIAYSITRHNLLDIRAVVARSVAYVLLVGIIGTVYTLAIFILSSLFFRGEFQNTQAIVYALLTLFIAFTFQPLKNSLEKLTNKVFFKGGFNSNELLADLTKIMASVLNLNQLASLTLRKLINTMQISKGIFLIFNEHTMYPPITYGFDALPGITTNEVRQLCQKKRILIFEDETDEIIKQQMRSLNVSVILPLYVGNDMHGLLMLGEKKSGDIYSQADVNVLEIFAPEISVAVQNSKSYFEIQQFNATLTKEIKKATQDLQAANLQLEELDKLKDDFVSIASHELRTPMTAIRSYAWMALNRPDIPLTGKLKRYLGRTLLSTERLINLVNDMLNISRIESGKVEITPKEFDMVELVKEILIEVSAKAKEKSIHLEIVHPKAPTVFADPDKVHEILLNLIGNSLKFTPEDGFVKVSFFSDGQMLETKIQDNGVGIPKDDIPRLFQKFGRLDNTYIAAATSGGTGLGLYICKSLITLMKGRIWATSPGEGQGAEFIFSLPVATREVLANKEKYTNKVEGEAKKLEPAAI